MERDIEHRCMTLLLRQQPVAGDLRHISTAMKVVTDIERMGDHASGYRRDHPASCHRAQGRATRRQSGHCHGTQRPTR